MSVPIRLYRIRLLPFKSTRSFVTTQRPQHVQKLVQFSFPRLGNPVWKKTLVVQTGAEISGFGLCSVFLVTIIIIYFRGHLGSFCYCPFWECVMLRSWCWLLALDVRDCGGSSCRRNAELCQLIAVFLRLLKQLLVTSQESLDFQELLLDKTDRLWWSLTCSRGRNRFSWGLCGSTCITRTCR